MHCTFNEEKRDVCHLNKKIRFIKLNYKKIQVFQVNFDLFWPPGNLTCTKKVSQKRCCLDGLHWRPSSTLANRFTSLTHPIIPSLLSISGKIIHLMGIYAADAPFSVTACFLSFTSWVGSQTWGNPCSYLCFIEILHTHTVNDCTEISGSVSLGQWKKRHLEREAVANVLLLDHPA